MSNEELVRLVQEGNDTPDNFLALYNQNRKFIAKIIQKYIAYADFEDLMQESFFAIVNAAKNYTPECGMSFVGYAALWIKQFARRYINNNCTTIRIPEHEKTLVIRYRNLKHEADMNNTALSDEELSLRLGISTKQLSRIKKDLILMSIASLNEPIGTEGNDSITLCDTIEDKENNVDNAINELIDSELKCALWEIIDSLDYLQKEIIKKKYIHQKNRKEIAEELDISIAQVQYYEKKALSVLCSEKNKKILRSYSDDYYYREGLKGVSLSYFEVNHESCQERFVMLHD